jgi:hypothetical protein
MLCGHGMLCGYGMLCGFRLQPEDTRGYKR